jgi:4-aminobutyrate aminotransferase-like enzyme
MHDMPDLLARRQRSLGPTYKLSYADPLYLERASGVWMFTADRAYLDAYNNVPVVGHCHPQVVDALERQARTLNANTRYAARAPVELAERLLATMPSDIGNVVFVCSGSEANELAVRVSLAATGATGLIVTRHAYHGTGVTTSGISPGTRNRPLGRDVYTVPAPANGDDPAAFGTRVRDCISRMAKDGVKPAALILDTLLSTDGIIVDPPGFMAEAVREIRKAGGLFIADEVQGGFCRTGDHFWGFQRHGVVPDLITMGKPMGNGHPVAAMAARPELMARFAKIDGYFNTFGGNTVACAVALAVLDVIEQEKLANNARVVGAYLRNGLLRLAGTNSGIGAVHGAGLYVGVEVLESHDGMSAKLAAERLVNGLQREGVLIGVTGGASNVLKIRPPLPFSTSNADVLLEKLEKVLTCPA